MLQRRLDDISLYHSELHAGNYDMWLPAGGVLNEGTGFLMPSEETTLTIPSTAARVITVGAYDGYFDRAAAFSGRGYTRETNQVKPDLVAPGVDITSCAPGGRVCDKKRNIDGGSLCDWRGSTSDAMGDRG